MQQEIRTVTLHRRSSTDGQVLSVQSASQRTPKNDRTARNGRSRKTRRKGGLRVVGIMLLLAAAVLLAGWGLIAENGSAFDDNARPSLPAFAKTEPQRLVVAIDPGHGGSDGGSEGVGFWEKEMTWQTAQELMQLLEADDRFAAFCTLSEEEYQNTEYRKKPSERGATAKAAGAGLLLSIHGNADPQYGACGFECYPATPGMTFHEESVAFAGFLAEGFAAAGEPLRGQNGIRYCYYDSNNEKQIAEFSDTSIHNQNTFTVLETCGCPAVLAEQCFVTSEEDVRRLAGEAGCRLAAQLYYEAICRWYEEGAGLGAV